MDNQPPVELRLLRRTELVEASLSKYRNEGNENQWTIVMLKPEWVMLNLFQHLKYPLRASSYTTISDFFM